MQLKGITLNLTKSLRNIKSFAHVNLTVRKTVQYIHLPAKVLCKTSFSLQGLFLRTAPIFRALLQQWSPFYESKQRPWSCLLTFTRTPFFFSCDLFVSRSWKITAS